MTNQTTGKVFSWQTSLFGSDPDEAEGIVEDVGGGAIPNFHTINFTASSGNGQPLNSSAQQDAIAVGSASATAGLSMGATGASR